MSSIVKNYVEASWVPLTAGSRRVVLSVYQGSKLLETRDFDDRRVRIGRHSDCELRLLDAHISRRHCEVRWEEGALCVVDEKSAHGTLRNGVRVSGRAALQHGDHIEVGPFRLEVEIPEPSLRATQAEQTGPECTAAAPETAGPHLVERPIRSEELGYASGEAEVIDLRRDPAAEARIRELDELIAALDRKRGRKKARGPDWMRAADRGAQRSANARRESGADVLRFPRRSPSSVAVGTGEAVSRPLPEAQPELRVSGRLPCANEEHAGGPAVIPEVGGSEEPSGPTEVMPLFEGIEVTARLGQRVMDVAILRRPGEEYVLGHRTPQGATAPAYVYQGLRLLRLGEDLEVELIFPEDVGGDFRRGDETVELQTLTEGRRFSRLGLVFGDEATVRLGRGHRRLAYDVRFVPKSFIRAPS